MVLFTLGDSHSLFSFAGVAEARLFWCGPVTMHRAARDGIASLVPKNCRPQAGDILVLSFGSLDSRRHIVPAARRKNRTPLEETDALLDRFEAALRRFKARCPATVALTCLLPLNPDYLEYDDYTGSEERRADTQTIRHRMNTRMAAMGVPFVDFASDYANEDGTLKLELSDGTLHIDSRHSEPVLAALRRTFGIEFRSRQPPWPPFPLAEKFHVSPWRRLYRAIGRRLKPWLQITRRQVKPSAWRTRRP